MLHKELDRENAGLVELKGRAFVIRRFQGKACGGGGAGAAQSDGDGGGGYIVDVDRGMNRDECSLTLRPVGIASIGYARDAVNDSFLPSLPSPAKAGRAPVAAAAAAATTTSTTSKTSKRSGRNIRSSERKRRSRPYQQRIKSPLPSKSLKSGKPHTSSASESMLALSKY